MPRPIPGGPRAVVWDVGHVLYDWDPRHLYARLIPDARRLDWFLANVVTREWHDQHDAGRPLADMIAERVAAFPAERTLIEAYATHWLDTIPGPIPGTHQLVADLAAAGVPQYAITNFGADTWAMFRPTAPLFDSFADILVSGREGVAKPDPAIFALARARFGLGDGAALFLDDMPANVAAARAAGWLAHRFTGAEDARTALRAAGFALQPPAGSAARQ